LEYWLLRVWSALDDGLLLLGDIIDEVNKRGCQVNSVNLSGIPLLHSARTVMASMLQLPLLWM
jgi:hypothetical protein